jgi:hypothetical protein
MEHLAAYQGAVTIKLANMGFDALWYDSGGGCMGIQVELGGSYVFSSLDGEGSEAWTTWDWNASESGSLLATLQIQVRPFNGSYGPPATPTEMATECGRVFDKLAGYKS